jgi:putative SOS response-associated peptidase YedK
MCGRFVRKRSSSVLAGEFRASQISDDLQPSFNVAPAHNVTVVFDDGARQLRSMRWGLVPWWATDPTIGSRLINARAETLIQKAAFKDAFRKRRCLVLADGFYEWQKQGGAKTPLLIQLESERPFGFAGLYETWTPPVGETLSTCTIITTEPNELVRPIHNRMPVILPKDVEDFWLDSSVEDHNRLLDILQPYPAEGMEAYAVSSLVNSVKNDSPACIEPIAAPKQHQQCSF